MRIVLEIALALLLSGTAVALAMEETSIESSRASVLGQIQKHYGNSQVVAHVKDSASAFEKRIADRLQVESTYRGLAEMLLTDSKFTSSAERANLAVDVIEHCANPHTVNQGRHNTCAFAALEVRTYTRFPEIATELIKQVALTKQYVTPDRYTIDVDAYALHPDAEAKMRQYGQRSFASQVFQITVANVFWQRQTVDPRGNKCKRGSIRYVEGPAVSSFRGDTGERIQIRSESGVETVVNDFGQPVSEPCVSLSAVQDVGACLSNARQQSFVIGGTSIDRDKKYIRVNSIAGLRKKLTFCQSSSAMPLVAAVNSFHGWLAFEPRIISFSGQAKNALPLNAVGRETRLLNGQTGSGWHAVCVIAYNEINDTVSIDNFWGPHGDHVGADAIPISQLYEAMIPAQ